MKLQSVEVEILGHGSRMRGNYLNLGQDTVKQTDTQDY